VGKDALFEVLAKSLADIRLGGVVVALAFELTRDRQFKPGLATRGHRLVQQRAFGGRGL